MKDMVNNMELLLYLLIVLSMIVSYLVVWVVALKQDILNTKKDIVNINDSMRYLSREVDMLSKSTVYTSIGGL